MQIRIDHVGNLHAPVIVVENAWANPHALIEEAASRTDYSPRSLYYPGVRSNAPPAYAQGIVSQLTDLIRSTFGLPDQLVITDSTFSITATPADKLVPFQRVPHFDSVDPTRIARLHYLCDRGGTSFYRHRGTGVETVTAEVQEHYIRTVNAEVREHGMPPSQYVEGSTDLFERIAKYDAVFNRALIYRGSMLHSVNVPPDFVPDLNPRSARLTLNTFLTARAAAQ
jgi:hypothetical protein